jgi:AbiU2
MAHDPKEVLKGFIPTCERLWMDHQLYYELFETDARTLTLYEATAQMTFVDLNHILISNLIIGVCQITDPAKTMGHENLTTNFIIKELSWPNDVLAKLTEANDRMMKFRDLVIDARRKRVAHRDLKAQIEEMNDLGVFSKGADQAFIKDLAAFVNVANEHLFGEPHPIEVGGATDVSNLVRALGKAAIYDKCAKCSDKDRTNAVLDYEARR